jgi:hypothetical protein
VEVLRWEKPWKDMINVKGIRLKRCSENTVRVVQATPGGAEFVGGSEVLTLEVV